MSCALTKGRTLGCRDSIGGIKQIAIMAHGDKGTVTIGADGQVTSIGTSLTMFSYELPKHTGSLTDNIISSVENGTVFYEQVLAATLHKLTAADRAEIALIAKNRLLIAVLDNNDNCFMMGLDNGAEITAGTIVTGVAKGDMNGYTLEAKAEEAEPTRMFAFSTDFATSLNAIGVTTLTTT